MTKLGRRGMGLVLAGLVVVALCVLASLAPAIGDSFTGVAIVNLVATAGVLIGLAGVALVAWSLIRSRA